MGWRSARMLAGSGLVAVGLVVTGLSAGTAGATAPVPAPTLPPDVAAYVAGPAVPEAIEAARHSRAGGPVPSDAATVGTAHQVYVFTAGFLGGDADATPVRPTDEWVAPLVDAGQATFVVRVVTQGGGPARLAGVEPSADSATSLTETALRATTHGVLVEDQTNGALYVLEDQTLTPLNHPGFPDVDGPTTLAKAQPVIARRIATLRSLEAAQAREARLRRWVPLGAAAVIVVAAVVLGLSSRPRRPVGAVSIR
ncbi:MAG TPA: hypothetical protein VGC04_12235 [Cellulomonas sp.]